MAEAIADGADLVTFSGDKLLGGPQAGFIVGRKDLIDRINRNPMKRALRVDKIRLAMLEATLKLYRDPDRLAQRLPTLRLLARPKAEIAALARRLAAPLRVDRWARASPSSRSIAPARSAPARCRSRSVPSAGLAIRPKETRQQGRALNALAAALRRLPVPVIGRIEDQALVLDLRCLEDGDGFLANLARLEST